MRFGTMFVGDGLRGFQVAIDHGHQLATGSVGVLLGVPFSQVTDTDHGGIQWL